MEIVKAGKPEVWAQGVGFEAMCEHIARCAAVCYGSTPKKGGAAVDFVKSLVKRGHGRPLEFGTINEEAVGEPGDLYIVKARTIADIYLSGYSMCDEEDGRLRLTYNMRTALDNGMTIGEIEKAADKGGEQFFPRVTIHYPAISRAIADEFRTHTTLSGLMRSTRYCREAAGGIRIVEAEWMDGARGEVENVLAQVERLYSDLLEKGVKPQNARDVLPLGIRTEMVQCGFLFAWANMLRQRTAGDAHPEARRMAEAVREAMKEEGVELDFIGDEEIIRQ